MFDVSFINKFISKMILPIILVVFMFFLLSVYKNRKFFQFAKGIGGPTFYPFIGNVYAIMGKDVFSAIDGLYRKYSLPCNLWIGHDYTYVTDRASDINIVLNHPKCFDKADFYQKLNDVLGNSILVLNYDIWKVRRKHFSKSFSITLLKSYVPIFYRKSEILVDVLKHMKKSGNIFHIFELYASDVFSESSIGVDLSAQEKPREEVELLSEIETILGTRLLQSYIPFSIWKIITRAGRRYSFINKYLRKFVFQILQNKREKFKTANEYVNTDALPLVDSMLLSEGIRFSNDDIYDELALFFGAEKLYKEVMDFIGDREICYEDLPNLKYTDCVIQEAMRLIPVTPVMGRLALDDIDLGDRILPKDSNILIAAFHVHRSEKYWKDPLQFDPDRFSAENISKIVPGSYIPFSAGMRNCIGKPYAMMSMKIAIANVVRHFHVTSAYKSLDELNFTSCVTMKTTHDLDCNFTLRCN